MKNLMGRLKCNLKDNIYIVLFSLAMLYVYIDRMFNNRPWYDELYTYYSFISRGPLYAAIHWPVPNNHVGYSVLSGCLDLFGNAYIGLRGVSLLAAVSNIILIYVITLKIINRMHKQGLNSLIAVIASGLYSCAWIVHSLSVQGRGYTLAVTCYLVATICLYKICVEGCSRKDYVWYTLSLILGLYILPSSVYWVIPICLVGGFYLLSKRQTGTMWKLIISSAIAAVCVLGLYMLIWLAIGANLMCKNPESGFYGLNQVNVILKAPFQSARTGVEYMLASPYIQSIDRKQAAFGMLGYFRDLFNQCYSGLGTVMVIFIVAVILTSLIMGFKCFKNNNKYFLCLYLGGLLTMVISMLLIQSVHPYKRVLSFLMVPVSISITVLIFILICKIRNNTASKVTAAALFVATICMIIYKFNTYDYVAPLADRENQIADVLEVYVQSGGNINELSKVYYTDDYQKYVLKFYYNIEPQEVSLEEANFIMIGPGDSVEWPVIAILDDSGMSYVRDNYNKIYENSNYSLDANEEQNSYTLYVR